MAGSVRGENRLGHKEESQAPNPVCPPCLPLSFWLTDSPSPQADPTLGSPFSLPLLGRLVLTVPGRGYWAESPECPYNRLQWVHPSLLLCITCFLPRDPALRISTPVWCGGWGQKRDIWGGLSRVNRSWHFGEVSRKSMDLSHGLASPPSPSLQVCQTGWGKGGISGGVSLILTPPMLGLQFFCPAPLPWRAFFSKDPRQKCVC